MRVRLLLFWSSILTLGLVGFAHAVTFTVTTGGSGCSSGSGTNSLATCLSSANVNAGDEIVLTNGTYTGSFATGRTGSSGSPITLRAQNRHLAFIENTKNCTAGSTDTGLSIGNAWWVVKDLVFRNQTRTINISAANTVIEYNIVTDFTREGIRATGAGATPLTIRKNIVGHDASCAATAQETLGIAIRGPDGVEIKDNIVVATGNNEYQAPGNVARGYGIYIADDSDTSVVQGNLLMANGGKGVMRTFAGTTQTSSTGHVWRDNIFLWGEGGISTDDCRDHANSFINNLVSGIYYTAWSTKGNSDGTRGNHVLLHNTFHITKFSRTGGMLNSGGCGGVKVNNTLKDSLLYSEDTMNSNHVLWLTEQNEATQLPTSDHNLFFAQGASSTWKTNYTYDGTDVITAPTFVNKDAGDFSLATGSAGENDASDASDIGIAYDANLKLLWSQNAFSLLTHETATLTGTTHSIGGLSSAHYYQVYFHIPDTGSCSDTAATFTVEGTNLTRNISLLKNNTWIQHSPVGPARWITLGRHKPTDTDLDLAWPSACADKFFIRQLPTSTEAFQWILDAEGGDVIPPAAPTNVQVTSTYPSQQTLTWTASGAGDLAGYDILSCSGPSCTPTNVLASVGVVTSHPVTGLTPNTSYTYLLRAFDTSGNRSGNSNTATASTPSAGLVARYQFNTGSGTVATDTVAARNGQLCDGATCPSASGPTWIAGKEGSFALNFAGTNDHVRVADNAVFNFLEKQDFTIAMWVRSTQAAVAGVWPKLFNKVASTPVNGIDIGLHYGALASWYGSVYVGGTEFVVADCTSLTGASVWHHIAVKRQGTTLSLYQDGVPCGTPLTDPAIDDSLANAIPIHMGIWPDETSEDYIGDLDDVQIYNKALSDGEIATLASPEAVLALTHFRFGTPDVSTLTWVSDEDTNRKLRVNGSARWRFQVQATAGTSMQGFPLQCSVTGAGGSFVTLPLSCASFGVCIQPDAGVAHGAVATNQLTVPGGMTAVNGKFVTDTAWPTIDLAANQVAEVEYRVSTSGLALDTVLCCRPAKGNETPLDSYAGVPGGSACLTIHRGSASLYGG